MRILSFIILLFVAPAIHAQTVEIASTDELKAETNALVTKYTLNEQQAAEAYKILERKHQNMADIAALQSSNMALYQAKWQNVQKGTWASIRRTLKSKEQIQVYRKTQADIRRLRYAKRKELTAQNAPKETIEAAVLAIYAE
ncbi:MAG: hypothetical protein R3A50_14745 [Saprospiraceae bacterium]|nr:hypothetical protein [Saprospiraceae bacterium]MCB9343176.1 hypothetical protein [Lewinellaceae bacterium]